MADMSVFDWLQLGIEIAGLAGFGFGAANRWAVANHRDSLASFTSAAANAAGRIRLALSRLPPNADQDAAAAQLVTNEATGLMREFDGTAARLGATQAKAEAMIAAHIAPPVVP